MRKYWSAAAIALLLAGAGVLYKTCSSEDAPVPRRQASERLPKATTAPSVVAPPEIDPVPSPSGAQETAPGNIETVLHGKVVDQNNSPVPDAEILCIPSIDPLYAKSRTEAHSAADGTFVLKEQKVPNIRLSVSATGYYQIKESFRVLAFEQCLATSPQSPAIFVLRKGGSTEPLLARMQATVLKEEQSYQIGLKPEQRLQVKFRFDPASKRMHVNRWPVHDWSVELSVPGGGIVEAPSPVTEKPDSFVAPLEGYQPSISFVFDSSMDDSKLKKSVQGFFFVKFQDGTYASIESSFSAEPGHPFGRVSSWFNPSGSRALEFDPSKAIEPPPP